MQVINVHGYIIFVLIDVMSVIIFGWLKDNEIKFRKVITNIFY